jgi:hypothetical protein
MIWNLEPAKPRSREHAMIWNLKPAKSRTHDGLESRTCEVENFGRLGNSEICRRSGSGVMARVDFTNRGIHEIARSKVKDVTMPQHRITITRSVAKIFLYRRLI